MSKKRKLKALAAKRKQARWKGYRGIGSYHCGKYECDHVSPYTKSAGNVDADIFVMLQDWSSHKDLNRGFSRDIQRHGYTPNFPTNVRLIELLKSVFGVELSNTYATNLFPFVKQGPMNARIPASDMRRAAREFAIPQVEIVSPKIVICLGLPTFRAMQAECGERRSRSIPDALANPFSLGSSEVWCQAHTGGLGRATRNRGGVDRVTADWRRMKRRFDRLTRVE